MTDRARLTLTVEQAGAVEDALSYYLAASDDNFGSGYSGEDFESEQQLVHERLLVADFADRVTAARERMS